jgi:hypothetical protein
MQVWADRLAGMSWGVYVVCGVFGVVSGECGVWCVVCGVRCAVCGM